MYWCDHILKEIDSPQIINDSKTPSGRVHVGSLRGVIIHDVVYRILLERGIPVRFLYGVDDYDPLDEIPEGNKEFFAPYLGMPLCNVPPPPESSAADLARHYIEEFFSVFGELGVEPEFYYMRNHYRSGRLNEAIDVILRHQPQVRKIYREVSKSDRPENWYPFQVICEQCGKIGVTEVTAYDGNQVEYTCRPDLVIWARGCGYQGKMSPFDGRGKLPWKLEWVAKWKVFGITIEGAGKDHSTKGGARDVSSRCLREIFNQDPPLNIPYEFFLVGGAKMSSSRGLGAMARDMADFLPPEIMRFLMLKTPAQRPVDFSPDEQSIIKLFNEFDRYQRIAWEGPETQEELGRIYHLAEVGKQPEPPGFSANFQLLVTLIQMPHLDAVEEIKKRHPQPLNDFELKRLRQRLKAARHWVDNYAAEEEKTRLQAVLPERARELDAAQRAFLKHLADYLPRVAWHEDELQSAIFRVARLTPLNQPHAFKAIYRVLLDRESGPKAGNLIAFLEPEFVIERFSQLDYREEELWCGTGISESDFLIWLDQEHRKVVAGSISAPAAPLSAPPGALAATSQSMPIWVIEFTYQLKDEKEYRKRILYQGKAGEPFAVNGQACADYLAALVKKLQVDYHLEIKR